MLAMDAFISASIAAAFSEVARRSAGTGGFTTGVSSAMSVGDGRAGADGSNGGREMSIASVTFEIPPGSEDFYREAEGEVRLTRARGEQRFAGDIDGQGAVEWLMCYSPTGGARFVGLQRIEGTVGDRRGSYVIEAMGDHDGARSKGTW